MSTDDKDTASRLLVSESTFGSVRNLDLNQLESCHEDQITCVIPALTKLLLNPYFTRRKQTLRLLFPHRKTNDMIQLMRSKPLETSDLVLNSEDKTPLDVIFESGSHRDRLRVVAIEYLKIQEVARQTLNLANNQANTSVRIQKSWLFDNPLYAEDIAICIYALMNKPPIIPVINLLDMCEALLHVKLGPNYIAYLVANLPDRCYEVCHYLITWGEKSDEGLVVNEISEQRARAVRMLCRINPKISFRVQRLTVQLETMPSLALMLTVDQIEKLASQNDAADSKDEENVTVISNKDLRDNYESALTIITGILLGEEESKRTWFAHYLKSAQKRIEVGQPTILSRFRELILTTMRTLQLDELDANSFNETGDQDSNRTVDSPDEKTEQSTSLRQRLILIIATLKYFCALRGVGMLKLESEESETLLNLITSKPPASQISVIFATVGVCTLLVCSSMIHNQKDERRAADWLKWLIRESGYNDSSYSDHGRCSISELLLLIAIHFQNNQTNQVAELVCATLGMKLQIKASVSKCKSLFVHEVFNDQMITEHAVKVPVTEGLDNTFTEFLPIHCIHQLLESRSFSKHQVPIQNWIYKQICQSRKPIHHMLPKLIEAYVNSVVVSTSVHGHCGTNQPISSEDIARIFKTCLYAESNSNLNQEKDDLDARPQKKKKRVKREKSPEPMEICEQTNGIHSEDNTVDVIDHEVAQVLLLFYLTLYEDVRLKKGGDLAASDRAKLIRYSPEFMQEIPVFYLMQLVRDNQDMFGTMLPYLLKLIASQYPHLCSIQHWLNTTDHYEPYRSRINATTKLDYHKTGSNNFSSGKARNSRSTSNSVGISTDLKQNLVDGFKNINEEPQAFARVISAISHLPRHEIWTFVDVFIDNWHKVLSLSDSSRHQYLISIVTRLWWKFNTIFPRRLWVLTTNSLRKAATNGCNVETRSIDHSWNELTSDPLIVLRCDQRVFRCPPVLNIVLHVLDGFLAATRRFLQDQIYEQTTRQRDNRNLEELRATLVLAQTSASIQILLESCLPSNQERTIIIKRKSDTPLNQEEQKIIERYDSSVDCICENLHQVFIADTNLAKLVHFQTYPSEILATTSSKIPSMHICLDFIPELLSQPDLSRQVFVIELTSHLCEKYAITKSLNVAKLCFNVAYTLLQLLPSDKRAIFFIPVLPALLRICRVFPILLEDAKIILGQINQITLAHMASTSSRLSLGSVQPFEGLDRMGWHEVDKLMRNLNLDEALYLCIQKCSIDTCDIVSF